MNAPLGPLGPQSSLSNTWIMHSFNQRLHDTPFTNFCFLPKSLVFAIHVYTQTICAELCSFLELVLELGYPRAV